MPALPACAIGMHLSLDRAGSVTGGSADPPAPHGDASCKRKRAPVALSLPGSRLVVGEIFSEEQLHALLYAPFPDAGMDTASCDPCRRQALLLYPETADQTSGGSHRTEVVSDNAARLRLVVLDGTWRKSRKMLYLNPMLQELPRLALQAAAPSQYRIRKAHLPEQLSTLEATCHALAQLEQDSTRYAPVLQAFDGFVTEQLRYRD